MISILDESMSHELMSDEAMPHELMSDELTSLELISDESMSHELMSDELTSYGVISMLMSLMLFKLCGMTISQEARLEDIDDDRQGRSILHGADSSECSNTGELHERPEFRQLPVGWAVVQGSSTCLLQPRFRYH